MRGGVRGVCERGSVREGVEERECERGSVRGGV